MPGPAGAGAYTALQAAAVRRVRTRKLDVFYDIMGLRPDCSKEDIKKAYRTVRLDQVPWRNCSQPFLILRSSSILMILTKTGRLAQSMRLNVSSLPLLAISP